MKQIIVAVFILLIPVMGHSAIIAVKPDATNPTTAVMYKTATSISDCSSADNTFTTTNTKVSNAVTAAGTAGTLFVCNGSYNVTMLTATTGTALSLGNITVTGEGQDTTVLDMSGKTGSYGIDTTAAVSIKNVTIQNTPSAILAFYARTYNHTVESVRFYNNPWTYQASGGTHTFKKVVTEKCGVSGSNSYTAVQIQGGAFKAYDCLWKNNLTGFYVSGATTVAHIYNSLFIGARKAAIIVNTSGAVLNLYNSLVVANNTDNYGNEPLTIVSGATINAYTSIVHPAGLQQTKLVASTGTFNRYDASGTLLTADGTVADASHTLFTSPGFITPRRNGYLSFTVDDLAALTKTYDANGTDVGTSLGTESYLSLIYKYANAKGVYVSYAPDSTRYHPSNPTYWSDLQAFVDAGNEVNQHARNSHVYLTNLNAVNLVASGVTSPQVVVNINRTNATDSTTWTGTVTVSDNNGSLPITVTQTMTISNLVALIAARTGWSGTTRYTTAPYDSANNMALYLANTTYSGASATMLLDQTAYWHYEVAEGKKEIEQNLHMANQPGTPYVVKTMAYPYNSNNALLREWIHNSSNFTPTGTTAFELARGQINSNSAAGTFAFGDDIIDAKNTNNIGMQIYNINCTDGPAIKGANANISERNFNALYDFLTYVGGATMIYSHSINDYSYTDFKSLIDKFIASPGVEIVTPSAMVAKVKAVSYDTSNSICTASGNPYTCCTGSSAGTCSGLSYAKTFSEASNLHIAQGKSAYRAGTPVSGLTVNSVAVPVFADYVDVAWNNPPTIGMYESVAPSITSFLINSGAVSTNNKKVAISMTSIDPTNTAGYALTTSADTPSSWSVDPITSYIFTGTGNKTLFAWAKDVAGGTAGPTQATIAIRNGAIAISSICGGMGGW